MSTAQCYLAFHALCVWLCVFAGDADSVCPGQQPRCSDAAETGRNDGTEQASHTGRQWSNLVIHYIVQVLLYIKLKKKFSCNNSMIRRMVFLFQAPGNWLLITLNNTKL